MHDVSRQVSISMNGVSVEMFVYITHCTMIFYAFELYTLIFWKTMLLHTVFPVLTKR
jgi:hypothetical protein